MNISKKETDGKVNVIAKPQDLWLTIKKLLECMKKSSLLIVLTIVIAIGGTVMQVISPKLLGKATTLIFYGIKTQSGIDFNGLILILLSVAVMYLGVFISSFLQERIMTVVAQKTTYVLRNKLKAKMNRVEVTFFDINSNGNLMSVAANDIDNIMTNLQQSLTQLISTIITVIGALLFMISISPLLTIIVFIMIPVTLIITKLFTPKTQKYNKEYLKSMGELNSLIEESYQGFSVIKSFNWEKDALQKFQSINGKMYDSGWKARFSGGMMMPCMMLMQNIIYVLIAATGAVKVVGGSILIGDMQAFLQYSQQFTSPIAKLSMTWANLLSAIASAERVFNILDTKEIKEYESEFPNKEFETAKVAFEHVKFGYTDKPLMTDFSMNVNEGQMVAIVGHTGAGKSTLINLLERFYDIQGGSIRIDGIDVRNLDIGKLRKHIGMVLQDTWLFSGTIFENIKYGNENATKEQVYTAAKAAYAHEFIQKLPYGYNTVLNEDAENISQGQRQLITIARAFVANPDILVLDEATSNVDSRTELIIQKAMKRLLKNRTSFVVAHRLSTIYDADSIVVMEKGDIAETGTHKELLSRAGAYADIYNSQFVGSLA
ncbi:ABC transporter ATP-binding protein [Clostridium beijerinckii]|uniref:ATP-binding cassette subfamily B protein n=2 Tax=Clostridium beijerinckii TaxID=1520 RepID=A0A9Q5CQ61_CLOBE|nr:ABC transporter ATP-binding protein [Clostridium beijerinckii]AQS06681.1 putative ABC transporter ATP-binding protein [Clostridium beijerinckii]MBA2887819.1 ATP-binding cassette subfamily B protein [Clostridium beijerinckii]MBA2901667.1 ATP-binding cassette subfamily B protein [Clostridium beijerinckii]MBA2911446.1 ATP-binding cassette subfamily B protein [Clostridium beijerinckii]MBA9013691.1 ATP-binding cassette subfamily B protein [Clostridium beijerinckii]